MVRNLFCLQQNLNTGAIKTDVILHIKAIKETPSFIHTHKCSHTTCPLHMRLLRTALALYHSFSLCVTAYLLWKSVNITYVAVVVC